MSRKVAKTMKCYVNHTETTCCENLSVDQFNRIPFPKKTQAKDTKASCLLQVYPSKN